MLDMLQDDLNLDDIVDIDLDDTGEVKEAKNDKIALVDADTIAYTACLSSEIAIDVLPREFYTDEEWYSIVNNPNYVEKESLLYESNELQALEKAGSKIQRILDKTGCRDVELHFSVGRENFRYDIYPKYKANRVGRAPAGLHDLKVSLSNKYNGILNKKWEADDMVVYLKNKYMDKYILVAIDKDVLNSVPGKNFNYYESSLYNKEMHWVDVNRYTSLTWRYLQTLMGDTIDNIIGLKGIGPKKAEKILAGCFSHSDLWSAVIDAYESAGRTKDEALINLNLVDMCLLKDTNEGIKIKLRTHEELLKETNDK